MTVGRRAVISWCLFDWATSPHPTIVVTFVFSAYFAQGVVGNEIEGTVLWSQAIAAASILVAIFSPLLPINPGGANPGSLPSVLAVS